LKIIERESVTWPSLCSLMPPGNQSFWVPGEVWLQACWRVEDRETAAAPHILDECVVPCYYRANTVLPCHMLVEMTWVNCSIQ